MGSSKKPGHSLETGPESRNDFVTKYDHKPLQGSVELVERKTMREPGERNKNSATIKITNGPRSEIDTHASGMPLVSKIRLSPGGRD